ncbi:MAG: DUF1292 domain-containing protein [Clostridiaceae bacterium]|nr:DUF1292 domain-containing protein [Clostridiaceae bacterium]
MDEFFDRDIMTLQDEDGNDLEVEHLDTVEYNGGTYFAFIPVDMNIDDSYELIIMKLELENGEEVLATLEDEDEYNEMYQIFSERLEESEEEEEIEEVEEVDTEKDGY